MSSVWTIPVCSYLFAKKKKTVSTHLTPKSDQFHGLLDFLLPQVTLFFPNIPISTELTTQTQQFDHSMVPQLAAYSRYTRRVCTQNLWTFSAIAAITTLCCCLLLKSSILLLQLRTRWELLLFKISEPLLLLPLPCCHINPTGDLKLLEHSDLNWAHNSNSTVQSLHGSTVCGLQQIHP